MQKKKLSSSSQKYEFGIRDPEKTYSGSRIPDPRVKKAPDLGSGSATLLAIAHMSGIPVPTHHHFSSLHVMSLLPHPLILCGKFSASCLTLVLVLKLLGYLLTGI